MASYGGLAIRVGVLLVALSILAILGWWARLPVAAVALATIVIVHTGWRGARQRPRDQVSGVGTSTSMSAPRAYHAVYVLNWLAVVALVLGFLGYALDWLQRQRLLWLALLFAGAACTSWVLAVALATRRPPPRYRAGPSAVAVAVIVAFCSLAGLAGALDARINESKAQCLLNVKKLALALQLYSLDTGGILPEGARWSDRVLPCLDSEATLRCPAAGTVPSLVPPMRPSFSSRIERHGCGYAFNSSLSGVALPRVQDAEHTVVIFESDAGWNAAGGAELLPDVPRHLGGDNYAFADGHVQWLRRKKLGTDKYGKPIWAKEPDADWVIWKPVLKKAEGEGESPDAESR